MPPPSPTSIRICSAKAPTPARASTTSTPSRRRSPAGCRTRPCSATICSRACFARAGLASDVEVVEDFPARYDVAALRHHRWARGDWQLLPWMFRPRAGRRADEARARRCPGDRPLEDAGQSAPHAVGTDLRAGLAGGIRVAVRRRGGLDRLHPADDPGAAAHSGRQRGCAAPRRRSRRAAISARSAPICGLALAQYGARSSPSWRIRRG